MPRKHKPRSGSLQFWPRKRARRIYPSLSKYPEVDEVKPLAFFGYKAGMTQVEIKDTKKGSPTHGQNIIEAVTVLETPPLFVLGVRAYKKNNRLNCLYEVYPEKEKIPKRFRMDISQENKFENLEKNVEENKVDDLRLILASQPHTIGNGKKTPEKFEIAIGGKLNEKIEFVKEKLGKEIDINEIFGEGEYVDVIGITKGKGFSGVVKRHGVKVRGRKDEKHHRHVGVIGTEGVGRVRYTVPQPGQLGFQRRCEYNKRIYKIGNNPEEVNPEGGFTNFGLIKNKYVILKGSIPGPKKRPVFLRKPMREKNIYPVKLNNIIKRSQQGK